MDTGELGGVFCGSGILVLLPTAVRRLGCQCWGSSAGGAWVQAAPLSHQASHKPPEVQVCLIIYDFSLDVENICEPGHRHEKKWGFMSSSQLDLKGKSYRETRRYQLFFLMEGELPHGSSGLFLASTAQVR